MGFLLLILPSTFFLHQLRLCLPLWLPRSYYQARVLRDIIRAIVSWKLLYKYTQNKNDFQEQIVEIGKELS